MPGGMQTGMQPRIDTRVLGCMHPGVPGVIKCRSACSSACRDACRSACRSN